MHELPVIEGIINSVSKEAGRLGIKKVHVINIIVGELSSIVDDSLRYYFRKLRKNRLLGKAVLNISRTKAIMHCKKCEAMFPAGIPLPSQCRKCGSREIRVRGGLEFYIDSIETEDEDPNKKTDI